MISFSLQETRLLAEEVGLLLHEVAVLPHLKQGLSDLLLPLEPSPRLEDHRWCVPEVVGRLLMLGSPYRVMEEHPRSYRLLHLPGVAQLQLTALKLVFKFFGVVLS